MRAIQTNEIEMTLTGERAPYGIDSQALTGFLTHLAAALRDFDRESRGEPTRKPGAPEPAAAASAALRIVRIEPGSAKLTLAASSDDDSQALDLGDTPRAVLVIDALLDHVADGQPLTREVATSLEKARRALGLDGAIETTTTPRGRPRRTVRMDQAVIASLAAAPIDAGEVTTVSGQLSRIAASPDRALIRAADGTEWTCTYDPDIAGALGPLWRTVVITTGAGQRTAPRKGSFRMDTVDAAVEHTQTALFTTEHIPTDVLLAQQGIDGPQGLDALAADELLDDETEDRYLAIVLGEA